MKTALTTKIKATSKKDRVNENQPFCALNPGVVLAKMWIFEALG